MRVSCKGQAKKHGLAAQLEAALKACDAIYGKGNYVIAAVFKEAQSGYAQHAKRLEFHRACALYETLAAAPLKLKVTRPPPLLERGAAAPR